LDRGTGSQRNSTPESLIKKASEIEKRDRTGAPSEGKADKLQKTNPRGDKRSILAAREPTRGHKSTEPRLN